MGCKCCCMLGTTFLQSSWHPADSCPGGQSSGCVCPGGSAAKWEFSSGIVGENTHHLKNVFFILELRPIICYWAEVRLVTNIFPDSEMTAWSVSSGKSGNGKPTWEVWDWTSAGPCSVLSSPTDAPISDKSQLPNTTTPYLPPKITVFNPLPFLISYNKILWHQMHRSLQVLMQNNIICCLCGSKLCPMGDHWSYVDIW